MGFTSMDNFINAVTVNGQFNRSDWNKNALPTTAQVAGEWYSLWQGAGSVPAGVFTGGTNLSFQTLTDQSTGAFPTGGIVSPATKHILNANAFSAGATTMPAVLMLVDMLGFYSNVSVTLTTAQACTNTVVFTATSANPTVLTTTGYDIATYSAVTLSNSGGALPSGLTASTTYYTVRQSASTSQLSTSLANAIANNTISATSTGSGTNTLTVNLPRYASGAGIQCFMTPSTVMGAATPNLSIGYINSSGTSGRTTPAVLPVGKTASPVGHISYSGVAAAGKYGPFMPLQGGDAGINMITTVTESISYVSGVMTYVLCKPLLTLPMTTVGVAAERDLMSQLPSLPRIYDGACLSFLLFAGAATPTSSAFYGSLDFGWA